MLRKVLATFAGIVTAVLVFMGFEEISKRLYPPPPGLDPADHQAMVAFTEQLPDTAHVMMLAGWATGSLLAGLIIRLIVRSRTSTPAYIAGLFLMTAGIVDIFLLPHPVWFIITGIVIFIPFTLLGHWLGGMLRKDRLPS